MYTYTLRWISTVVQCYFVDGFVIIVYSLKREKGNFDLARQALHSLCFLTLIECEARALDRVRKHSEWRACPAIFDYVQNVF